jgi:histidine ammonia-lyase
MSGADAMRSADLVPIELASKEGLSLINGTQFMTAQGVMYGQRALRLVKLADVICALSVEALRGTQDSFLPQIHQLRPHPGQRDSAANMHMAMEESSILESHRYCDRVQDAYALRCAPQVHGATRDALTYAMTALATEAVSVTDNPLVFADEDLLRSNGNFHGQPVAIPLDVMAIALAELANISERRIERLVNPSLSGLPAFLAPDGGLNSGYMIAQYTAASLVSENKVLSHPASVDSIPTSAAQEDHVSMGNHAGIKLGQVLANAERVLTIEALCAAQGVDFLEPRKPGRGARALYELIRGQVPYLDDDRVVSYEIEKLAQYLSSRSMLSDLENALGAPLN